MDLHACLKKKKHRQNKCNNGFHDTVCQTVKDSDSWEMGKKASRAYNCPLLILYEEFPSHSPRRGNQGGAWYTWELSIQSWMCEEVKVVWVLSTEHWKRENCRESSIDLQCPFILRIQLSIEQCNIILEILGSNICQGKKKCHLGRKNEVKLFYLQTV